MAIRPRGATSCCPDCMDRHKLSCGCGCIPEWLCIIAEFTSEECCRYATVNLYHQCNSDDYSQGSLACGEAELTVTASVTKTEDGCCFTVTLSNSLETLTFSKCGDDFEVGFGDGEIEFEIQVNENYPPRLASGTLTVSGLGGVTNNGQFGDLETGECPPCGLIRLNPRALIPDLPVKLNADEICDRPILSVAVKAAEQVFGPIDGRDPDLFDDEFCWFVAPCHCIPDSVCVSYTTFSLCEGSKVIRRKLTLTDCGYGPDSFTVDRGGAYGDDTVTIEGILGSDDCTITWKVTSTDYGEIEFEKGLSRILLNSPPKLYSKRCDVTLDETTVTGFETDGVEDTIQVTEDCLCLESADKICPSACEVARMPPGANPDCYLVVLTATVMSGCEFGEFSFEMHASTYEQPPSITSDHLVAPGNCQLYHGYNPDLLGFYVESQFCTTNEYVEPYPTTAVNVLTTRFTLYYPSGCSADDDPTINPYAYVLMYEVTNSCGLPSNTLTGSVNPISASCTPFELVFEVPNNPECSCGNCSTLTVKVTL